MMSLTIGPFSLSWERLLIFLSLAVAFIVGALVTKKENISIDTSIIKIFLVAMLAARIGFVIRYWSEYQTSIWSMIDIRDGGFDGPTAIVVGTLVFIGLLSRKPQGRAALFKACMAGMLVWSLAKITLSVIEDRSQQLPSAIVHSLRGEPINLNQLEAGRPRVINLWATWCPPCRREMPVLAQAQQQMKDIGFVFVNQGDHAAVIELFLQQEELLLDNIMVDPMGVIGYQIGSRALPTTLFVNARGQLVGAHLGELSRATLKAKLEKLKLLDETKVNNE